MFSLIFLLKTLRLRCIPRAKSGINDRARHTSGDLIRYFKFQQISEISLKFQPSHLKFINFGILAMPPPVLYSPPVLVPFGKMGSQVWVLLSPEKRGNALFCGEMAESAPSHTQSHTQSHTPPTPHPKPHPIPPSHSLSHPFRNCPLFCQKRRSEAFQDRGVARRRAELAPCRERRHGKAVPPESGIAARNPHWRKAEFPGGNPQLRKSITVPPPP